nr:diheme cytochrome c [Herbaspirillum sp. RV1423]
MADNDRRAQQVPMLPKYQHECAACHIAYPPGMLPAASWERLLNNLPRHYGTDASLDPATVKQLATWLTNYAGTYTRVKEAPAEDRITRSAWFIREHDEVSAATWKLPAVKSAANCIACHTQSDKGDFNERHIRIPR